MDYSNFIYNLIFENYNGISDEGIKYLTEGLKTDLTEKEEAIKQIQLLSDFLKYQKVGKDLSKFKFIVLDNVGNFFILLRGLFSLMLLYFF